MTYDVQFITLVDALPVMEALEIEGASPRTIRLYTRNGFLDAVRVLINDYGVDDFTVVNDSYLLVRPPQQFNTLSVAQMYFDVVSASYNGGKSARLLFGPTKNVRRVSGLQKLVQVVVKTLLSNTNSNKFDLGSGGGLLKSIGSTLHPEGKGKLTATVSQAISRTEEQVRAAQSQVTGLSSAERLLSLQLVGVNFNSAQAEVRVTIRLVTFAGKSIDIPLAL